MFGVGEIVQSLFGRSCRSLTAMLFVASALVFSGCGKNEDTQKTNLRVINLAPETGNIGVRVEDETNNLHSDVSFRQTTAFKELDSGGKRIRVSNSGGVILDQTLQMDEKSKHLLVVYGGSSSQGMTLLKNDISSASSGKTKLRLLSYGVGLPTFDLYMTTGSEDFRTVEPRVRNTGGTLLELDNASYTIRLTAAGTKDVVFEMPARNLEDRKYYNLVLFNEGSSELPNAFWLTQDDDAAPELLTNTVTRIRAINSQAQFSTVNVNVGNTRVFTNVSFGGISSFTRATAGTRTVSFAETTNGTTVGSVNDVFTGGRDYSVFLAPNGNTVSAFRVLDRNFPPGAGKVRVRLLNATDVGDLSLVLSFTATTPSIGPRAASDYFEVNAGDGTPVTITVGAAGTPLREDTRDLSAGRTYTFVVSGTQSNNRLDVRQDN
jgi:hypothetical protein